tara:strand:- start:106862 stop:107332 length:471 start_codon:yes stop_codon:yes gene_type:complete
MSIKVLEKFSWDWKTYKELSKDELYKILRKRQQIFSVEQESWYLDADNLDQESLHLLCIRETRLVAYLRLCPPNLKYDESCIGRVVVDREFRKQGLGKLIVFEAIEKSKSLYKDQDIKISAQFYLKNFYQNFGFRKVSDIYDEDGIDHIEMLYEVD